MISYGGTIVPPFCNNLLTIVNKKAIFLLKKTLYIQRNNRK